MNWHVAIAGVKSCLSKERQISGRIQGLGVFGITWVKGLMLLVRTNKHSTFSALYIEY